MTIDRDDIELVVTEAKILGTKLDNIKDWFDLLEKTTRRLRDEQILTNTLLTQIRDVLDKMDRPSITGPR